MSHPIPKIVYVNPHTLIVAALPYPGHTVTRVCGWTVKHPNGTTGLGRKPFATQEEAQAWCDAHPDFAGM